jgi:hypothetical protein
LLKLANSNKEASEANNKELDKRVLNLLAMMNLNKEGDDAAMALIKKTIEDVNTIINKHLSEIKSDIKKL